MAAFLLLLSFQLVIMMQLNILWNYLLTKTTSKSTFAFQLRLNQANNCKIQRTVFISFVFVNKH